MTDIRPCKRPPVVVVHDQHNDHHGAHCQLFGCEWRYGPGLKTDVEENAARHRRAHRDAVPKTRIVHGVEWDVHCEPCGGHRRTFGTRVDAQAWLDHHLSTEHGLVT